MKHKVKVFDKAKAAEGADIALKNKLFVSGWELSKTLTEIREKAARNLKEYTVALSYKDGIPVAVVIREGTFMQAFCRRSERRKGHASACARAIRQRHPDLEASLYAFTGVEGSYSFWKNCLIQVS
jgi:hypothetical protein